MKKLLAITSTAVAAIAAGAAVMLFALNTLGDSVDDPAAHRASARRRSWVRLTSSSTTAKRP